MHRKHAQGQKGTYDAIILGAGMAGLSCAKKLTQAGLSVLILEARNRVGGRVHTVRLGSQDSTPLELGAEFIHGAHEQTLEILGSGGQSFYDVNDTHHSLQNTKLKELPGFFEKLQPLIKKLGASAKPDRSVKAFLQAQRKSPDRWHEFFSAFVEGFHAADLNLISERGLAATQETDEEGLNGSQMFRPTLGYDRALNLMAQAQTVNQALRLSMIAKNVTWKKGMVHVACKSKLHEGLATFSGRRLVVTLPLGVLQAPASAMAGLAWSPRPRALDFILANLYMGHVQKLNFRFRTRFWEKLTDQPLSFIHLGPETFFPTWWTLSPVRSPDLVAWQGGPKAQVMSAWSKRERCEKALSTLSRWSGRNMTYLYDQLESCTAHDWSSDPFSLGAYSYVGVGGLTAAQEFSKPIEQTIYFAGEATCTGPSRGTVHGALSSGAQAAAEIMEGLSARP